MYDAAHNDFIAFTVESLVQGLILANFADPLDSPFECNRHTAKRSLVWQPQAKSTEMLKHEFHPLVDQ